MFIDVRVIALLRPSRESAILNVMNEVFLRATLDRLAGRSAHGGVIQFLNVAQRGSCYHL
jgi:hypothetical protein